MLSQYANNLTAIGTPTSIDNEYSEGKILLFFIYFIQIINLNKKLYK